MRNIMLLFILLSGYPAVAQNNFSISGNIPPKLNVKKVYLSYRSEGKDYKDSSGTLNNTYFFRGSIPEATKIHIAAEYNKETEFRFTRDVAGLYIEAAKITVNHLDSFSQTSVHGSKSQETYIKMNKKLEKSNQEISRLGQLYGQYKAEGKNEDAKSTVAEIGKIMLEQRSILHDLFFENISSPFAIHILEYYENTGATPEQVDSLYAQLPQEFQKGPTANKFNEKLEKQRKLSYGKPAPEFIQPDTSGIPVALSSFRGRYLLIDFWASWCGPCREENPYIVKAFSKYKDKGFHVLSVSLDQKNGKERWLKAIRDDQLTWTHVSDLQFWGNAVAVKYNIESIPQNFLLDPAGKIIARNLRGESLEKALEQIYKQ
jgi:thiol-disulfide isomerase/thioredoxin